jgi:hypothetical protein
VTSPQNEKAAKDPVQFGGILRLALPDYRAPPSKFSEQFYSLPISKRVAFEFFRPIADVRLWHPGSGAFGVRMPEAAVNEQHRSPPVESEVGVAGQIGTMKPKAESQRMRCFPHGHFGGRVFRFHLRHRP